MSGTNKDKDMARSIASLVRNEGGRTYYVGGYVRDRLLGIDNKDIDIEVHNIAPDRLRGILSSLGTVQTQGASFGVYNIKGYDIDIAQPRRETSSGRGHKDFEVYVDPFIGEQKAAERRDFTINALMQDVLTGEITDPYNGIPDLRDGIIRHVNDATFVEDPLRAFRAAQFAARFGFDVAPETKEIISGMDVSALSRERVYGEMKKALIKAQKSSVFFETLRETSQLDAWFPEVQALIGCPQDSVRHPEGDVWNHTMLVLDAAGQRKDMTSNPEFFMVSALCHDFGKTETTAVGKDGRIHSYGHENAGVNIARDFLGRLNNDTSLQTYVFDMMQNHMRPHSCFDSGSKIKTTNHMFDSVKNPSDLCQLAISDALGKTDADMDKVFAEESFLSERLKIYENRAKEPMVTGKDLIQMGLKPSPAFSEILANSRIRHFSGQDKSAVLKDIASTHKASVDKVGTAVLIAKVEEAEIERKVADTLSSVFGSAEQSQTDFKIRGTRMR